jgi:putative hydrolase of the HAD superfamily
MTLRCVAFDLDGVVIPSEPSFAMFEQEYGITRQQFHDFFSGTYRAAMLGTADLEAVLEPTVRAWNWNRDVASFITTWFRSCDEPEPEAVRLVRLLRSRGITTCAATNQDERRAAHLDSMPWLREAFPSRFFSCRLGVAKPEAEFFHLVQSRLGIPPAAILFLDDKPENVEGARAAGWQAVHVPRPSELGSILNRYFGDIPA